MQMPFDVSVAIPAFNAAPTVVQAVESVLSQEGARAEVIVVDDGSSDATSDVVRAASAEAEEGRVRLLHHAGRANRGVAASRNLAVDQARAPFVAFLDADDWLLPGSIASRLEVLQRHDVAVLAYGRIRLAMPGTAVAAFVGAGVPGRPLPIGTWLLFENPIPTSTVMVRRSEVRAPLFPETLHHQVEDWAAWMELCRGGPAVFVDRELAVYRQTPTSWSNRLADRSIRHAQLREEAGLLREFAFQEPTAARSVQDALAYRAATLLIEAGGQLVRLRFRATAACLTSARAVAGTPGVLFRGATLWLPGVKLRGWFPRRRNSGSAWKRFIAS